MVGLAPGLPPIIRVCQPYRRHTMPRERDRDMRTVPCAEARRPGAQARGRNHRLQVRRAVRPPIAPLAAPWLRIAPRLHAHANHLQSRNE